VNGNLTVNGNISTTGLRVTGTLSIASTSGTNDLGPVYAVGNIAITGAATNNFGALWTDGSLTLSGSGATSATTLHAGSGGMSIGSTTGTNTIGPAYIIGGLTTTSACTSSNQFADLWVDGTVTLGDTGSAETSITTLHAGVDLTISSLTGTNRIGPAYVVRNFSTASASTSPNQFQHLWVGGTATLNGRAATTTTSLHVGGAFSINNAATTPAVVNSFGPTWVVGNCSSTATTNSTNRFGALWVDGNVTLNGTTTTNANALHAGGDFTILGPTSTNTFGPIYVIGDVNWGGTASVKTTDYVDTAALPAPMWIGGVFTRNGGPFNDEYGDTFIVFQVNFTPTGGFSTVMCPLFASTERITTSGNINFGTMVTDVNHPHPRPMTLYMVCDNDGYYTQTCNWGSTGQFYGLMILFEAGITLQNGNATAPAVVGSVLTIGGDNGLNINNNAQIAYCQDVVDWVFFPTTSTSTVTQTVPGTWQELSPSGQ